jgi:hypothetical protein
MAKITKRLGRPPLAANLTRNQLAYQQLVKRYSKGLIAEFAGTTPQLLTRWTAIPPKYVEAISARTGIPVTELLPDPCEDCQNPFCAKNRAETFRAFADFDREAEARARAIGEARAAERAAGKR